MDLVLATGGAVAFEPGLHTPEACHVAIAVWDGRRAANIA